jgi:hypothetical protein
MTLIRDDPGPEEIRKLAQPDSFERIDLHETPLPGRSPIAGLFTAAWRQASIATDYEIVVPYRGRGLESIEVRVRITIG